MTPLLLAALSGASVACPERVTDAQLRDALQLAESRFIALDVEAFGRSLSELSGQLPCLDAPLPPPLAARLHTLIGLQRYGEGRTSEAIASFKAARASAPDDALLLQLVPATHELHGYYAAALDTGPRVPLPAEGEHRWLLDGRPADGRPADRPTVAQALDAADQLLVTRYLLPVDPLPPLPHPQRLAATSTLEARQDAPPPLRRAPSRWTLLALSGIGASGSALLYGLAAASAADYASAPPSEVNDARWRQQMQRKTNGLLAGSVVSLGLGAAAGAAFGASGGRR